ncbi:MAG TPA: class I SAM-dependent methyltransferase [Candidatus Binatia bacterium]|nr:class I SAM-dependent methyltransferase [Candidatus Binatia bacterium]
MTRRQDGARRAWTVGAGLAAVGIVASAALAAFGRGGGRPAAGGGVTNGKAPVMAEADPATHQNVTHSLATQEVLGNAAAYNRWLVDTLQGAWAGAERVLDVGCSIGNVTGVVATRLAETRGTPGLVVGIEIIPDAAQRFAERFADRSDLRVVCGDITEPTPELREFEPFDAAVSFNVIEHIEDDVGALRAIANRLGPGGRLGVLVPGGGRRLYGTLDALDRHYRRYTPSLLGERFDEAGFEVISIRRVNMIGALLWFLKGRVVRSQEFHAGEVKSFDRVVPILRRLDSLCGPPFGQSLAAVGRVRHPSA